MATDRPTLTTVTIPVSVLGLDSEIEICPYEALDAIVAAQATHGQEDSQWLDTFRHWIAAKIKVAPEKLHQQQVVAFNDIVVQVIEALREDRKKKVGLIVDWLLSTRVSPQTFGTGTTS